MDEWTTCSTSQGITTLNPILEVQLVHIKQSGEWFSSSTTFIRIEIHMPEYCKETKVCYSFIKN